MAKQSIPQASYPVNNVRLLPDQVKGDAPFVKGTFDKGTEDGRTYINGTLIPALNGNTGANMIGLSNPNLASDNVGDSVEEIRLIAVQAQAGELLPNSVNNTILGEDVKVGSLATLNTTDKSTVTGAINELEGEIDTLQTDLGSIETTVDANTTNLEILRKFNLTTGSNVALAVDTFGVFNLTKNGNILNVIPNVTNTGAITINPDGQGAKSIKKFNVATDAYVDVVAGDVAKNTPLSLAWILASDFFVLAPKGGATIKSIQRGNTSVSTGGTTRVVTVTNVDVNNSILLVQPAAANNSDPSKDMVQGIITNGTTLTFTVNTAPTASSLFSWTLIEFNNVKSKQTGNTTVASTFVNITTSSIDVSKSLVFSSFRTTQTANAGQNISFYINISNSTTISIQSGATGATHHWQLIEFN